MLNLFSAAQWQSVMSTISVMNQSHFQTTQKSSESDEGACADRGLCLKGAAYKINPFNCHCRFHALCVTTINSASTRAALIYLPPFSKSLPCVSVLVRSFSSCWSHCQLRIFTRGSGCIHLTAVMQLLTESAVSSSIRSSITSTATVFSLFQVVLTPNAAWVATRKGADIMIKADYL